MRCVMILQTVSYSDKLSIVMPSTVSSTSSVVFNLCHLKEMCIFINKSRLLNHFFIQRALVCKSSSKFCMFICVCLTYHKFYSIFFGKVDRQVFEILVVETNRREKFSKGGEPRRKLCFLKSDVLLFLPTNSKIIASLLSQILMVFKKINILWKICTYFAPNN